MNRAEIDHLQKDYLRMTKIISCLLKLEKRNKEREREKEMWKKREKGHIGNVVVVNTGKKLPNIVLH